eukprot:gnl/Dysnectes_brevis/1602_a1815_1547.p1 GENE.gnl/Dysnectes_brevis/1602_a1815_1547~~gnl/Dysnectes_brevis/1602_a1815_1547.p1  ORF type:complete len:231 (+),score=75.68 gnl/Dysnectes_brevis/1602_a1815_1547:308-1000(+)
MSARRISRRAVLPHGPYIMNLASQNLATRAKSGHRVVVELAATRMLGLDQINIHPGSGPLPKALTLIAESVRAALDTVPDVKVVFENTAGGGTTLGVSAEQLLKLVKLVDRPGRVGICLDTQHAFAAGWEDLRKPGGVARLLDSVPRDLLRGMHLNDSLTAYSSRRDRHAHIGDGEIGSRCFRELMKETRLHGLPLVLETPGGGEKWVSEVALLKSYIPKEETASEPSAE